MDADRRNAIARWRDATLHVKHGSETAARRLAAHGPLADVVDAALAIPAPTESELSTCDFGGEPLDPTHGWWGYSGQPCAVELTARRRGLPWPPG